jgi:hypothetical protein
MQKFENKQKQNEVQIEKYFERIQNEIKDVPAKVEQKLE